MLRNGNTVGVMSSLDSSESLNEVSEISRMALTTTQPNSKMI